MPVSRAMIGRCDLVEMEARVESPLGELEARLEFPLGLAWERFGRSGDERRVLIGCLHKLRMNQGVEAGGSLPKMLWCSCVPK